MTTQAKRTSFFDEIFKNKVRTALLIFVFIAIIVGLGFLFSYLFRWGIVGLILACVISIGMSLFGYFLGDKMVLASSGAKPADKRQYAHYINTVEGLAIAAGIPQPNCYVIQDEAINAFACGRSPKHASIAMTTGALAKLNREELEGVIAHEMSHIKNFDIRLMTVTGILVGIIVMVGDFFLRGMIFGGSDDDRGGNVVLLVIGIAAAILAPIMAQLIQLAVSRKREYLADATGAMLCRNPQGLANALKKIQKDSTQLHAASNATAHLYISNPFRKKGWLVNMFSTHPPLDERIRRLESM